MTSSPDRAAELVSQWEAELPDALSSASELVKRILVLAGELESAARPALSGHELTFAEFDVVAALRRNGSPYRMKPRQLSQALMLSTGGTSNVTNHLVQRGLVEREPDPDDLRSSWVRLTAQGVQSAEAAVRSVAAAHAAVFIDVSAKDLDAATAALRRVAKVAPQPTPPDTASTQSPRGLQAS